MIKGFFLLSLLSGATAFSPAFTTIRAEKTVLFAASSLPPKPSDDGWTGRSAYKPKSTTPVATKKVSWLERQTMSNVIIEPSYFLTWAMALLGPLIMWYHRK